MRPPVPSRPAAGTPAAAAAAGALRRRRELLLAAGAAALTTACGGGGEPDGAPAIDSFAAERSTLFVGEQARLTAHFRGGSGRIEPGVGPVRSGVPVLTPVLDQDARYTLIVDAAGRPAASRSVELAVGFRDRYRVLAGAFAASQHSASAAADGRVVLIGGWRGLSGSTAAVVRLDPATGLATQIGALAAARHAHVATPLADGRILVSGGMADDHALASAEVVDPGSGQALAAGTMALPRSGHAALRLADGRVLVSGGLGGGGARDDAELWDPATRRFRQLEARMHSVRWGHTMSLLHDGRVLIVGGYGPTDERFAEVFDPRSLRFAVVPDPRRWRASHVAHVQADGRVLVLGGETIGPVEWGETLVTTASVLRFDPALWRFEPLAPLAAPRTWASSVMLPSGQVLLFGGQLDLTQGYTATAERYDPRQGGRALAALSGGRAHHTATRLADGRILIAGGEDHGRGLRADALVYE